MADWAVIRRLVADCVPPRQVSRDLGGGRSTVTRALASDGPSRYKRQVVPTSFTLFEPLVPQLLAKAPDMPATVIAERVGGTGRSPASAATSAGCVLSIDRSFPATG